MYTPISAFFLLSCLFYGEGMATIPNKLQIEICRGFSNPVFNHFKFLKINDSPYSRIFCKSKLAKKNVHPNFCFFSSARLLLWWSHRYTRRDGWGTVAAHRAQHCTLLVFLFLLLYVLKCNALSWSRGAWAGCAFAHPIFGNILWIAHPILDCFHRHWG